MASINQAATMFAFNVAALANEEPIYNSPKNNSSAEAGLSKLPISLDKYSQEEIDEFKNTRPIIDELGPERFASLYEIMHHPAAEAWAQDGVDTNREDSDLESQQLLDHFDRFNPGELLITYGIMHNPLMEEIASNFDKEAIAFANDVSINLYIIEKLQEQNQNDDDYFSENSNESPEEKRQRKHLEDLKDLVDHFEMIQLEKERLTKLSAKDETYLRSQSINLGGKNASALEWVNTMDNILDNWDDNFNQMVSEGYAKPDEKDQKKLEIERLRKLMARTDLSEAQKQQLIDQGVASGLYSQETVNFVQEKQTGENSALYSKYNEVSYNKDHGGLQISTQDGNKQLETVAIEPTSNTDLLKMNSQSITEPEATAEAHKPQPAIQNNIQVAGLGF